MPAPAPPAPGPPASTAIDRGEDAGAIVFVRAPPPVDQRRSVDACAYPGEIGQACIDALTREPDVVRAKYMQRIASAYIGRGPKITAATHAEVAECCNAGGTCGAEKKTGHADCPRMDDGYACLVAAELGRPVHARACQCSPGRARIPVPGGSLACDAGVPVKRAAPPEADEIIACATCRSPAACRAEIARVEPDVAAFIERVVVTRCQLP